MNYDVFISYNNEDKPIADAVCHYIEGRRLRCFIAPRDITHPDWAENIASAIEHSKAFVIIVSKHSINSNEVGKEVTLATRLSNYIFPFRIDDSELDGRLTYHLSAFHWIDAMTPPLEKRIQELAERVATALAEQKEKVEHDSLARSRNWSRQRLLGQSVCPRAEFVGRSRELQIIHERFTSGTNAIFLTGMGGIGKSEIAKAYAKTHNDFYKTIVFASCETDLMHMIANDQAIPVDNLQQASGQGETIDAYYRRKMKVLKAILDNQTLIIIDNFDVESDLCLEAILRLPCKLLWTTRTDFSTFGYETIHVGPLENFEDLVKLFSKIDRRYVDAEDQTAVDAIIRLLDCHTYAVSLVAAQMKAGRIKPSKMLSQLQQDGLNIQTRGIFARDAGAKKASAYEFIQALFDFSVLDESSRNLLRYLACMPQDGVNIDLFMECCRIDDFGDISRLADLNWIQLDNEQERVSLHMLVKELVWHKLQPTTENCATMLNGAYSWATNAWNKSHEENCSHNAIIFSLLETFTDPSIQWLECFEELATFAWIQGRFDLAERCEMKLYALCQGTYGEISVQAGNQALRVGAVYHNMGDYAGARVWYEKGLVIQEQIDPDSLDAYTARSKVARSNVQQGKYEIAEKSYLKNLAIANRHYDNIRDNIGDGEELRKAIVHVAFSLMNMALTYACLGCSEVGLRLAQAAYDYLREDTIEPSLIISAMDVLVYIYHQIKEYDQAADFAQKVLDMDLHYHGDTAISIMFHYEMQGDLLVLQEQYEQAAQKYALALGGRELHFPADMSAITRLEKKYDCAQRGINAEMPFLINWP